ncbi:hypothetical protein HY250_03890 [Candidatus Azambacteria bacterium]|nr:hypothetical protein [Candidatus Azambacteria bacterium]MBI3685517.1 hypothetical protein [Candidatus Azambacteria bacterium]
MKNILDVLKSAANAYKLVLENDKIRVLEVTLKPGEKAAMHNHPNAYFIYMMNDAKVKLDFPDGKSGEFDLKTGHTGMRDAGSHEIINIGTTIVRNLIIELK